MTETEFRAPFDLLDSAGRLRHAGWARAPLARFNRSMVAAPNARLREWEFYTVQNATGALNVTLARIGLAEACVVDAVDYATHTHRIAFEISRPGADAVVLPTDPAAPAVARRRGRTRVAVHKRPGMRSVAVDLPKGWISAGARGTLTLEVTPADSDSLAVFTPFTADNEFFYEHKAPIYRADGEVTVGDLTLRFTPDDAVAVLDWGRGVWPGRVFWEWAAAAGDVDGRFVGLNLGGGFGDMRAASENVVIVDGHATKLGTLKWESDGERPWRLHGAMADLELEVLHRQETRASLAIKSVAIDRAYGRLRGTVHLPSGPLELPGLHGFAEEVAIRW